MLRSALPHAHARPRPRARRRLTRAALALWVLVAMAFSLVAAPFAAAGTEPGAVAGASASSVAAASGGSLAAERGQMVRPAGQMAAAEMDTAATQLLAHGFETWPGPWTLWSANNHGWGRTTYRKTAGTYSAYCVGSSVSAPGPYPNNVLTWMTAGPFDLTNYDQATLSLDLWLKTEKDFDVVAIGASTDNDLFQTWDLSGDSSGWVNDLTIDLEDFYGDGTTDFTGKPRVWIAIIFFADEIDRFEGAYVDDVLLSADLAPLTPPVPATFVAGADRIATAIEASKIAYPAGAETVIIATGRNWPDALGGSALAGVLDAPILLTEPTALPLAVLDEIDRLGATEAIILGGTGAVGSAVKTALEARLGQGAVERIEGANRYETADKVAARVIAEQGVAYDGKAFVATGANFPDALAAAPLAAANGWPLYLASPSTGVSGGTRAAMAGVTDIVILGSTGAVPWWIETGLSSWGYIVTRLGGATRYHTAALIAQHGVDEAGLSWGGVGIATGENYPDALAGGVLQAKNGSVMLLTRSNDLSAEPRDQLMANRAAITKLTLYGGLTAITQRTRNQIYRALMGG